MAQELFIQPRFVGERFNNHSLPLSAARDLAAYEELVIELASHLYKENHPRRKRVPKGFSDDFQLHIERIDDGSARPYIAMFAAANLVSAIPAEFTEARDLINEVISTEASDSLPSLFPKEYYNYFNRIGRSLEDGESLEWAPDSPGNKAVLTPVKRKRLALAAGETYEAEVDLEGSFTAVDSDKSEGVLRTLAGEKVPFSFGSIDFKLLKPALGERSIYLQITGVGIFDVNDKLKSVAEIERHEMVPHLPLLKKIEELSKLSDGWLEGGGIAPDKDNLDKLSEALASEFPEGLAYPSVIPIEDGNISLEWAPDGKRIELEVNFSEDKLELYATLSEQDQFIDKEFTQEQWTEAFQEINTLIQG